MLLIFLLLNRDGYNFLGSLNQVFSKQMFEIYDFILIGLSLVIVNFLFLLPFFDMLPSYIATLLRLIIINLMILRIWIHGSLLRYFRLVFSLKFQCKKEFLLQSIFFNLNLLYLSPIKLCIMPLSSNIGMSAIPKLNSPREEATYNANFSNSLGSPNLHSEISSSSSYSNFCSL